MINQHQACPINKQRGVALVLLLIFLLILAPMITALLVNLHANTAHMTVVSRTLEEAYEIAEGGVKATIFRAESLVQSQYGGDLQQFLTNYNGKKFNDNLGNGSYEAVISGPVTINGDSNYFRITSTGTRMDRSRTVQALIHGPTQPKALDFTLYGNFVNFQNGIRKPLSMFLTSNIYSNSAIVVDGGAKIDGQMIAVQDVLPDDGPYCNSNCKLADSIFTLPAMQGNNVTAPVVPTALVLTMSPMPPVLPFPAFNFAAAKAWAIKHGTYFTNNQFHDLISNADDFARTMPANAGNTQNNTVTQQLPAANYPAGVVTASVPVNVMRYKYSKPYNLITDSPLRPIILPTPIEPARFINLGANNFYIDPQSGNYYEVVLQDNTINTGDPDQIFFVDGDLTLEAKDRNTLVRIEGSLIVNGKLEIKAGCEILQWENKDLPFVAPLNQSLYNFQPPLGTGVDIRHSRYPAIAASDYVHMIEKDKGAIHIEGVVYSTAEIHLHHENDFQPIYIVGNETGDVVTICPYTSLYYDPAARTTYGFSNRSSFRADMSIVRMEAIN